MIPLIEKQNACYHLDAVSVHTVFVYLPSCKVSIKHNCVVDENLFTCVLLGLCYTEAVAMVVIILL